ncbi:telomeric repeat-binding factor 1 isoform X2 [Mixophyes fleayi]|uniref:telomeric repeat-binding factor 1 isoform X2 n=1 Tax=Mixophyes fleayi TaxID=3061075 RepID=UPI003F4D8305
MEESAGEAPPFAEVASVATAWVIDYMFASLCHYFNEDDGAEGFQRTCKAMEVLLEAMPTLGSENMKAVLIAQFLTRVAEGKHLDVQFETDEKLTPLETAVMVLRQFEEEEENLRSLQEEIETLVKIQAVAVCMEKGKFKLSSEVLDRQFEDTETNKYLRMKLSMVIGKKDPYHEFINNFSYTKMLKKIKSYIHLFLARRPPVFLLQAATKVVEAKVQRKQDNKKLSCPESGETGEDKDLDVHTTESLQTEEDNSSSECENTPGQKSSIDLNQPQRRLFSLEQRTPWHPDNSCKKINTAITKNTSSDNQQDVLHTSSGSTRKKQPWTWEEDHLLKKGVKKYGMGNWRKILVHYKFNNRTGVMLKDRWRTMKRLNIV